jgi:hypothetical protein
MRPQVERGAVHRAALFALLGVISLGLFLLLKGTGQDSTTGSMVGQATASLPLGGEAHTGEVAEERVPLTPTSEDASAPGWWHMDPDKVALVLAFWDEALLAATAEVFSWRNDPKRIQCSNKWLKTQLQYFLREDGRRYQDCDMDDFTGLVGDPASEASRILGFQREAWGEFRGALESAEDPLRKLPIHHMTHSPMEFPVEFFCYEYLGSTELPDDPVLDQLLNEARNRAIHAFCSRGGDIFIMQNAMSRCIRLPGVDGLQQFPNVAVFRQLIPAYDQVEEDRELIAQAYRDEIRLLLQVHGYYPSSASGE